MFELPFEIDRVLEKLCHSGYEAYLVGGAVRDMLMDKPAHDYDVTTSATPEETERVFEGYKVIKTGIRHGTVTVLVGNYPVEITTFRREGSYTDGRHPDAVFFSRRLEDDLSRRDLTVNAVAYSPVKGLSDPFGGVDDIKNRIIRCVGDPDERFSEDHLRLLRALRFSAVLGFAIERGTAESIHKNAGLIRTVSAERVFSELCRLVCGDGARMILEEYRDVITAVIPELSALDGDAYAHTVGSLSYTEPFLHLRLAALLHDTVAAPSGRDDVCVIRDTAAKNALVRLRCPTALCDNVCRIIRYCGSDVDPSDKISLKRLASKTGIKILKDVIKLKRADVLAGDPRLYHRLTDLNTAYDTLCETEENGTALDVRDLAINGNDVKGLGVRPGPAVGELLRYALDGVISDRVENEKAPLLAYVAEKISGV